MIIPRVSFFFRIVLAVLVFLPFWVNFRLHLSIYIYLCIQKKSCSDFARNYLNLYISLGRIDICTMPILPIYKHDTSLHLFRSLSFRVIHQHFVVFSKQVLSKLSMLFVGLYLDICFAVVSGVIFLISVSVCSLLVFTSKDNWLLYVLLMWPCW